MTDPTPRQSAVLAAIVRHMAAHGGQVPTFDELKDALGLASKNGVNGHLVALEKKKLITFPTATGPAQARGIRVCGLADAVEAAVKAWATENGVDI